MRTAEDLLRGQTLGMHVIVNDASHPTIFCSKNFKGKHKKEPLSRNLSERKLTSLKYLFKKKKK